ncbi:MAG TPA: YIP1 family protein [Anaeromyxobacteraceae bacterium]|nr:YIP1 family protein [Anaeromyxobacteraceae bacterium]
MSRTDLSEDGSVLVATLADPERGLAAVASRRRALVALAAATLASVLVALATVPRLDFSANVPRPQGPDAQELTQFQQEEAAAQAQKIGAIAGYAGAALGPTLAALGAALGLFLAFKVAGTRPELKGTFAVAAHALLPLAVARLLTLPAVFLKAPIPADELPGLLPSSAAAFLPAHSPPALVAAASSLDLFALWAAVLLVIGMARVAGSSRRRAAVVVAVLWLAQVALLRVVPAALAARGGPPGGA